MGEWREETEAEEQGGRAGKWVGGSSAAVSQYGPVAALAKNCRCASVKEDLGFGKKPVWGSEGLDFFVRGCICSADYHCKQ